MPEPRISGPRKGIYFLPSLFTTVGLFFGFYAIIQATLGHYAQASIAILIAMIMDGFDGRVARWTNTTSDFGKEYDSLVDVISFGVAPGMLIYFWSLQYLGKAGWLISFAFTAATALRLARFNTITSKENRYFFGLACPPAAAFVAFWVWNFHDAGFAGSELIGLSALITFLMSMLMVSRIKYRSFKDLDPKNRIPFILLLAIVGTIALISFDPPLVLFVMALAYVLSGPVMFVIGRFKGVEQSNVFLDEDELDPEDGTENDSSNVKVLGTKNNSKSR
ncbi:MAG: CDP-diacylglycerol--serine O-phosphatidyltransferase [Gammaproteobacteria bacterium]|nr:CDP-diacylglycerol--serine O-phosphatidyltransferase [Gammaproteobacteria bacterium]MCY4228678.1 CDP-diacylglycerol--serine O-phosphatidyltransferase [Gammaproteobacteria bacterium]MCY4312701.1 CDP-diacylglycerol--serine O-phosphatidyltransferase [Gammaproteobacteria bacterium]